MHIVVADPFKEDRAWIGRQLESVGHEVYPLLDTDSTTEPVPLYKGSSPPTPPRSSMIAAGTAAAAIVAGALLLAIL